MIGCVYVRAHISFQLWLCTRRRLLRNQECCASYFSSVQCSSVQLYCSCGEICLAAVTQSITINSKCLRSQYTNNTEIWGGQGFVAFTISNRFLKGRSFFLQMKIDFFAVTHFPLQKLNLTQFFPEQLYPDWDPSIREQSLAENIFHRAFHKHSHRSIHTPGAFSMGLTHLKLGQPSLQCLKIS